VRSDPHEKAAICGTPEGHREHLGSRLLLISGFVLLIAAALSRAAVVRGL
jgi:hypothetical protein